MIIVLFGLPGTGKSFAAEIFKNDFGFYLYDADKDLPPAAFRAIQKNRLVSEVTRRAVYKMLAKKAKSLERKYGVIVMPRTFTRDYSRHCFKKLLPRSQFILVKANRKIRYRRIIRRNDRIDLKYAKKIEDIFEKPTVSCLTLKNDNQGKVLLKSRIQKILKKLKLNDPPGVRTEIKNKKRDFISTRSGRFESSGSTS